MLISYSFLLNISHIYFVVVLFYKTFYYYNFVIFRQLTLDWKALFWEFHLSLYYMLSLICLGAGGLSTNPMIETFTLCFRDGRKIRRKVVWVMFHDKGTHIYIKLTGMKYVPNHLIIMKDVYKTWTGVHGPQKHTLVVIAYVLEGLSHKSELLWDRRPPPP